MVGVGPTFVAGLKHIDLSAFSEAAREKLQIPRAFEDLRSLRRKHVRQQLSCQIQTLCYASKLGRYSIVCSKVAQLLCAPGCVYRLHTYHD